MKRRNKFVILGVVVLPVAFLSTACQHDGNKGDVPKSDTTKITTEQPITIPVFNADSAYDYTKTQVDFGPRIPGTKSHQECLNFIVAELTKDSLHPIIQKTKARTFDGKQFEIDNVVAPSH